MSDVNETFGSVRFSRVLAFRELSFVMEEGRAGCFVLTLRYNLVSECSAATGTHCAEVPRPVLGARGVFAPGPTGLEQSERLFWAEYHTQDAI